MKKLTLTSKLEDKLSRLQKIHQPIGELFYRGIDINEVATKPTVAIVGSRKPTPYGIQQTTKLAEELSKSGVVIVSGLALGVDAIAHEAALSQNGICIAVLPSDVDHIYPATNRLLGENIVKKAGALVSEFKDNKYPKKVDFLIRNRIVAALSDAIIVTEAAAQSGTLNTARHAREMGIPIYAVPGAVNAPMSAGCNWLIQNAAKLLTNAQEIMNDLGVQTSAQQSLDLSTNSPEETLILQKISLGYGYLDEMIKETGFTLGELQEILTMLEIESRINQTPEGKWQIS